MGILDNLFKKKEKPPADFSNVRSGHSSTAPAPTVQSPQQTPEPTHPAEPAGRTYIVAKGDSLSLIAKREYGDAAKWRKIYDANRDIIKNPDLIYPGQKLKIPES